jgi:CRISPR-associated protein Csx14
MNRGFEVTVDERNPGMVLACCGLLELAHRLWPGAEGRFDDGSFIVTIDADASDALGDLVKELRHGQFAEDVDATAGEAMAPVRLRSPHVDIRLDWWLESGSLTDKTRLKTWAGNQKIVANILSPLLASWPASACGTDLFFVTVPATGRLGVDPRASFEALDLGYSANDHKRPVLTSPATEVLAALGLQRFRPRGLDDNQFAYVAWRSAQPIPSAAAAFRGANGGVALVFERVARGHYGYFAFAQREEERDGR